MTTPDFGIQKNAIQKANLPLLDSSSRYLVRYRVKTSDGIAATAWSPVYKATKPSIESLFTTTGGYSVSQKEMKSHGKSFDVSWKITPSVPEQIDGLPLDVYVKWNSDANWTFLTTTTTNSFSVPIPTAYQSSATVSHTASFMVHLATFVKNRVATDTDTLVFLETNVSTGAKYDAGTV